MLMKYSINMTHPQFYVAAFGFCAILLVKEMKCHCWSHCREQRVAAFLALPFAYHRAFYFTVFIDHDNNMIVNLLDAISESGCNLKLDE